MLGLSRTHVVHVAAVLHENGQLPYRAVAHAGLSSYITGCCLCASCLACCQTFVCVVAYMLAVSWVLENPCACRGQWLAVTLCQSAVFMVCAYLFDGASCIRATCDEALADDDISGRHRVVAAVAAPLLDVHALAMVARPRHSWLSRVKLARPCWHHCLFMLHKRHWLCRMLICL